MVLIKLRKVNLRRNDNCKRVYDSPNTIYLINWEQTMLYYVINSVAKPDFRDWAV